MIEQKTWNHPEGERDVVQHDRIEDGIVVRALAIAVGTIVGISLLLWAVLAVLDVGSVSESLVQFITCLSFFIGFLAGGFYVGTHASHDRMLQATVVVIGGFVLAAIGTVLDVAFGAWLGNLMPGQDANDAAEVHLGFWTIAWVAVPTATYLAASVVPRGDQGWGTQYSEPEDTEI